MDVNTCWDLAVAVGLDGTDHIMVYNTKNDDACAESNPQPSDVMSFPCPRVQKKEPEPVSLEKEHAKDELSEDTSSRIKKLWAEKYGDDMNSEEEKSTSHHHETTVGKVHRNRDYEPKEGDDKKPVWFVYQSVADSMVKDRSDHVHGTEAVLTVKPRGKNRVLLQFDDFDMGKPIISATLSLVVTDISKTWPQPFGSTISAYTLTQEWDEAYATGLCADEDCKKEWTLYDDDDDDKDKHSHSHHNKSEKPYDIVAIDTIPVSDNLTPKGTTVSLNVTEDVKEMIAGLKPNFGWLIAKTITHENDDGEVTFCSRENPAAAQCAPKLIVQYGSSADSSSSKDAHSEKTNSTSSHSSDSHSSHSSSHSSDSHSSHSSDSHSHSSHSGDSPAATTSLYHHSSHSTHEEEPRSSHHSYSSHGEPRTSHHSSSRSSGAYHPTYDSHSRHSERAERSDSGPVSGPALFKKRGSTYDSHSYGHHGRH